MYAFHFAILGLPMTEVYFQKNWHPAAESQKFDTQSHFR